MKPWLEFLTPKSAKPGHDYVFPTPSGAQWKDFMFVFTAREKVVVTCRDVHEQLEPEHLKMKDARSGKPTLQWNTLLAIMMNDGELSSKTDPHSSGFFKQQKKHIREKFQATFGLSDDPLPWQKREGGYRAQFRISASDSVKRDLRNRGYA